MRGLVLGGLCLIACALATVGLVRWWRRAQAKRRAAPNPYRTRYPVVLVHGVLGFDQLSLGVTKVDYFRGIPDHLRRIGAAVFVASMPPVAGVAARAQELANFIERIDAKRVNLIAHSMGGLDARYAISELDLAKRVASLTTIGTPHRGTPLAALGAGAAERTGLRRLAQVVGLDITAFHDLTPRRMKIFNQQVLNQTTVQYGCYLSAAELAKLNPLLMPTYLFLKRASGRNDGLVPESSQTWGAVYGEIAADHWAQMGWSTSFDAPAFYASVLSALRAAGH